ncbi:MAG TPA: HD domain-containing protein [Candidatus Saccharimonadales bacterium]
MDNKIEAFKQHVIEASSSTAFVHHQWFVKWHLEIVERIAEELLVKYPDANKDLVRLMVWLHDYGKILDYENQYATTLEAAPKKLRELGFSEETINRAVHNIETLDKKLEVDLNEASIEVKIVSSADGLSHLIGPFMALWWYENADKSFEDLMEDNLKKAAKDWNYKIVLPEARQAAAERNRFLREQCGELPVTFLDVDKGDSNGK